VKRILEESLFEQSKEMMKENKGKFNWGYAQQQQQNK